MTLAASTQRPKGVIWLTGLSGAGKTTLALALELAFSQRGDATCVLDGDDIRRGVSIDLGFSQPDRAENNRRVAEIAKLVCRAGVIVVVALISPRRVDRENARGIIGHAGTPFYEVFVDTPIDVCEKRDPKGLYRQARAKQIDEFTGIHSPYEEPLFPDLIVHPAWESVETSVRLIIDLFDREHMPPENSADISEALFPQTNHAQSTSRNIDASWLDWTRHNLERQCPPEQIRQILLNNGFRIPQIREAMGARYPIDAMELDHCALANIKVTQRDSPAERIKNKSLQLYTLNDFLSGSECDALALLINQNLRPSMVTTESSYSPFRTSWTCDLSRTGAPIVGQIDQKIADTLGINLAFSEPIQGQRYLAGQEFKPHTDFFEPRTKEYEEHCHHMGNRTWTFMIYLTEVADGGGTAFLKVRKTFFPKKGMAVLWNNLRRDGSPNPFSLHSGEPVLRGEKIIITKWFRERAARSGSTILQ